MINSRINQKKLGDISTVGSSKRIHLSDYVKQGVPFYRSKEIIELANGQYVTTPLYISESKYKEIKDKFPVPKRGDILITSVGTIGKSYLVKDPYFYFKDGNLTWLRDIDEDSVDINFLLKWLKSDFFLGQIERNNIGAVQKALTIDYLRQVDVLLPELDIQRKIAAVLSALDDKIELNSRINTELEQMVRTLYDYWFIQFDFHDANGKPYKSFGGQMIYNDQLKREIPGGWQSIRLQDILEFEKGTEPGAAAYSETKNDEHNLPFYRVGDIEGETSTYIDSTKFNAKIVKPSDVIVTFDGSVGKIGIGLEGAISGGLRHIYDKTSEISDAGVYAIFRNEYITKTIERYATGSVILHASSAIPYLAIPYDEKVFAEFQKIIEPLFAKIIANRQESQKLAELRDWLLPMLMNGQVKVTP